MRESKKTCCSDIKPIVPTSFTTKTLRWLHSEAWEIGHWEYFGANRGMLPQQIFTPPPFQYPPKNGLSQPQPQVAQWILTDLDNRPIAWAELHLFHRRFKTAYLCIGGEYTSNLADFLQKQALSFLTSGLIILTKPDLLTLVIASPTSLTTLEDLAWGDSRVLVTPLKNTWRFTKIPALIIDPVSWWLTENGKQDRATLTYLEKRLTPIARRPPPRWRGIIGLFRPRVG